MPDDPIVGYGSSGLPITASQAAILASMGKSVAHPLGSATAASIVSSYSSANPLPQGTTFATGSGIFRATGQGLNVRAGGTMSGGIESRVGTFSPNTYTGDMPKAASNVGYMDYLIKTQQEKAGSWKSVAAQNPNKGFMDNMLNVQTAGKITAFNSQPSGGYMDNLLNVISGGVITGYDTTDPTKPYSPPDLNVVPETITEIQKIPEYIGTTINNFIESATQPFTAPFEQAKEDLSKYALIGAVLVGAYLISKEG